MDRRCLRPQRNPLPDSEVPLLQGGQEEQRKKASSKKVLRRSEEVKEEMPKLDWDEKHQRFTFRFKMKGGESVSFQATVKSCCGSKDEAKRICVLCFEKFQAGAGKDEVKVYRDRLYSELRVQSGTAAKAEAVVPIGGASPETAGKGMKAHSFWFFVAEALRGERSCDPLCRRFRLEPTSETEDIKKAMVGVRQVLDAKDVPSLDVEAVKSVAITQFWARARVPGYAAAVEDFVAQRQADGRSSRSRPRDPHLRFSEVLNLLSKYPEYLRLSRSPDFKAAAVPRSMWPKGWQLRHQNGEKATADCIWEVDLAEVGREAVKQMKEKGSKERKVTASALQVAQKADKDSGKQESLSVSKSRIVKPNIAGQQKNTATQSVQPKSKSAPLKEPGSSSVGPKDGGKKAAVQKQLGRSSKAKTMERRGQGPREKGKKACDNAGKAGFRIPPSKAMLPNGSGSGAEARERKRRKQEVVETRVTARKDREEGARQQGKEREKQDAKKKRCIKIGDKEENKKRCSICRKDRGQSLLSCKACSDVILKQRGLFFQEGQQVWCAGFGPMWPARITAISFESEDDKEPFCVRFFGDQNCAWVGEAKLRDWKSRKPPALATIPKRWRAAWHRACEGAGGAEPTEPPREEPQMEVETSAFIPDVFGSSNAVDDSEIRVGTALLTDMLPGLQSSASGDAREQSQAAIAVPPEEHLPMEVEIYAKDNAKDNVMGDSSRLWSPRDAAFDAVQSDSHVREARFACSDDHEQSGSPCP